MTDTVTPLNQQTGHDGTVSAADHFTPVADRQRGSMVVPPTTVVPVVFVPGIMGSNLRDKTTKESVWNTNSTISILLQWIFRSAKTRQSKLRADAAEVDPTGAWYGRSASISDDDTGTKRGEGTTSKAFYGSFVRWLDDTLNANGQTTQGVPSPWQPMVGQDGTAWHAEKAPQTLTDSDASFAWDNFYCPVHVVGYNWLQSNGESGKYLAQQIDKIIAQWNGKADGDGPKFKCQQVILVSHSMGGLVTRAAVHPDFGGAADKVVGIVHGEQPSNGAAAAYHHCRSGYGGVSGWVLGRNAAQVTAVFANSPGAMELLPNQQYPKGWLKAKVGDSPQAVMELPVSDPYDEIYSKRSKWWRLVDASLIDPVGKIQDPWSEYLHNVTIVSAFHYRLAEHYHRNTYSHYGADEVNYPAWGDIVWHSNVGTRVESNILLAAVPESGSNPVSVFAGQQLKFSIVDPADVGYPQPGDGTVPACSGDAANTQGGGNVKQSFRLTRFEHQAAYDNEDVRQATLYSINMLLQQAKVL